MDIRGTFHSENAAFLASLAALEKDLELLADRMNDSEKAGMVRSLLQSLVQRRKAETKDSDLELEGGQARLDACLRIFRATKVRRDELAGRMAQLRAELEKGGG